jgi:O-methyltransferase
MQQNTTELFQEWLNKKRTTTEILQTDLEAESLYEATIKANEIDGDMAEVGVYNCGSATIINEFKSKNKKLYLFDTFKGLVDCQPNKDTVLKNGEIKPTIQLDAVKDMFKNDNVDVISGYFPNSAPNEFKSKKFSLIHLDVDTYQSTLNSLNYFYDKMSIGGYIICHDYKNQFGSTSGVPIAVDEFLSEKNEKVDKIVVSQCIIIKL